MHYLFLIVIFKNITPMYKEPTIEELSYLKLCYGKPLEHFIILKKMVKMYC